ncbi:methylenetetrahydrofolate reductase [Magnetofaba australis]|uniref:Methylenetetrahydrofolate reductase n=1 Tax=Magnetofaba australis IT-1 TaxID=1434232 RepID=A0A1Y2K744_9PROT|nr:methylenetetrahydrofolate reductase [Magnetofaba australis]OSM05127.1 putative 5,10-methylenetetrahydrofolate reductase [Magnetofaba australis IT-1]
MRISVELTPRTAEGLEADLALVAQTCPQASAINIPDLARFAVRSWSGCVAAKKRFAHAIPHIRAWELAPDVAPPMCDLLLAHGIDEVLVVTGDPAADGAAAQSTALQAISAFKKAMPNARIYAALDPYRAGFRQELDYVAAKVDVGADGFFTQPFFDLRLMTLFAEMMHDQTVFWGVSPVTSEKSQAYWERVNKVVFPRDFTPTVEWNINFAHQALDLAEQAGGHVYLMPIRIDLATYLTGVFERSQDHA